MHNLIRSYRGMYMDQIFSMLDNDNLIIISGVRRAGKSCIAMQLADELQKRFTNRAHIIQINHEKNTHDPYTADELITYLKGKFAWNKKNYIILDEITRVEEWEQAVNFLHRLDNCKVILISSNRHVISPKLEAILEERCDTMQVYPLSLQEFIQFQQFKEISNASVPLREKRYQRFNCKTYSIHEIYRHFTTCGGLPILKPEYTESDQAWVTTDGSYCAIVTRDILEIDSSDGLVTVTNPFLLRNVVSTLIKKTGENVSATWIGKQTSRILGRPIATKTIQSYIQALLNAHMFYLVERFDIRTGQILKTLPKYYVVDACFHHFFADAHMDDESCLLENKIYFELLQRGYTVYNGKIRDETVTFVAMKGDERIYIQVTHDISEDRLKQLFSPFRKIKDNHKKVVISLGVDSRKLSHITYEGFIMIDALEFLMGKEIML